MSVRAQGAAAQLETLQTYAKQATGQKYLINPNA